MIDKKNKMAIHRFLDEAGDTTFYGKGKSEAIGSYEVSYCFIIGMVKFKEPLEPLRMKIIELQEAVSRDPYFNVPSMVKKIKGWGYYFHATDGQAHIFLQIKYLIIMQ